MIDRLRNITGYFANLVGPCRSALLVVKMVSILSQQCQLLLVDLVSDLSTKDDEDDDEDDASSTSSRRKDTKSNDKTSGPSKSVPIRVPERRSR